ILFRAALANHLSGDDDKAQVELKQLNEQFKDATANIRGVQANLAEVLSSELSANQNHLKEFAVDSWPMPFGSRDRARIPEISTYGAAKLFSIEVERPNVMKTDAAKKSALAMQYNSDLAQGVMTGIIPVVDRGELFFQDNANVYAVSVESGYPLPGWAETY